MSFLLLFSGLLDAVTEAIGTILYTMFSMIFLVIDVIQTVFTAFAGIGDIKFGGETIHGGTLGGEALGGGKTEQGIVYYLMQSEVVTNLLFSIMLLALLLIVIFTTMAFLKNLYVAKPKGWKDIIGSSIKGLANFIFLPICCLLAVWMGNVLLQAINGATSSSGAVNMSRKLFICCAYNANYYRNGKTDVKSAALARDIIVKYGGDRSDPNLLRDGESAEYYAQIVDQVYAESPLIDLKKTGHVGDAYSLWEINYLIMIVGGIFMCYVLGSLAFAMVKRLFYLLVLFVVSPAICALYPLDDGSAVKSWSGEVKKQVLSAYGSVAGLNIFFSLLPMVEKMQLTGSIFDWPGVNALVQLFVMISGLLIVKDLMGLLSNFVGGDNAFATGSSLMKDAHGAFKKQAGNLAGKATSTVGAFVKANATRKAGGSFWGSIKDSSKDAVKGFGNARFKELTGIDMKANWKTLKDSNDAGETAGIQQKQAREFHEKYTDAYARVERAQGNLDSTKGEYSKVWKSDEARAKYEPKIAQEQKELDEAKEVLYNLMSDMPAALSSQIDEKEGKKLGISGSEYTKKRQEDAQRFFAEKGHREAKAKLAGADGAIDAMFDGMKNKNGKMDTVALNNEFGANVTQLAQALNIGVEDLARYLKTGTHLSVDNIDFDALNAAGLNVNKVEVETAASVFNRRVDQEQSKRDSWQGDMDKFAKMMSKEAANQLASGQLTSVTTASGNEVAIDEATIKRLGSELKDADGRISEESQAILQALNKDAQARQASINKQLSKLENIEKALKNANKK